MEYAKIGELSLNIFDKTNKEELEFIRKLCKDETIGKWFQGIMVGLNNPKKEFFKHSFLVTHNKDLVGYINIGSYNEEESCVYLRAAIDKDKRGSSYGKMLLSEVTDYIFTNYNTIESVRLKIDFNNKPSLNTAIACGYVWLKDDYYIKNNPYYDINKTK